MARNILLILFFLLTVALQLSFIASLPWFFPATPLVLVLSVYLIQLHSILACSSWLIFYGLILDYLHLGSGPLEILTHGAAAVAAVLFARRLFSNRSLYGVVACVLASYFVWRFFQILLLLIFFWLRSLEVDWRHFLSDTGWGALLSVLLTTVLFYSAGRMRQGLRRPL